jgi:hypothetical protein
MGQAAAVKNVRLNLAVAISDSVAHWLNRDDQIEPENAPRTPAIFQVFSSGQNRDKRAHFDAISATRQRQRKLSQLLVGIAFATLSPCSFPVRFVASNPNRARWLVSLTAKDRK